MDAFLKKLSGYRYNYVDQLEAAVQGQPSWLHAWFPFWINLHSSAPTLLANVTA